MKETLQLQEISSYLQKTQCLKALSTEHPERIDQLIELIASRQKNAVDIDAVSALFKAEASFHQGSYEQALAEYMPAKGIPLFEFFCYRATAYVSFMRDDIEKAKSYIEKALDLQPEDYDALKLYHSILEKNNELELATQMKELIRQIEQKAAGRDPAIPAPPEDVDSEDAMTAHDTSHFIAAKLGVDLHAERELEARIQEFREIQLANTGKYLEQAERKRNLEDHALFMFNGFGNPSFCQEEAPFCSITQIAQHRKAEAGFFIRWNGKGIAVNPGCRFLEHFHREGLCIQDIHYVIVTRDTEEAAGDIKRIYELNYQLNKVSPRLHVIHYYLNHDAYQSLSPHLKPNFKQERNTVHGLELFLDSPDVEKETLAPGIELSYFSTSTQRGFGGIGEYGQASTHSPTHSLGLRLELTSEESLIEKKESLKVGYVSGTCWSPLLSHYLGSCDVLIAGFGTTNSNDYGKLNYNENCLGYFGTYTLFEEVKPAVLLCTEFDGREGDIRLEVAKKIRTEYQNASPEAASAGRAILPADTSLFLSLKALKVKCSISQKLLDPNAVTVVKSSELFGTLHYLAPSCVL